MMYKTAWYVLVRIRKAMGQRDETHRLSGAVEFDDAFLDSPTTEKKRGHGTEKASIAMPKMRHARSLALCG
ncbi:MAG: hypothetical protein RSE54_08940 [Ruthenibacterium sp.]